MLWQLLLRLFICFWRQAGGDQSWQVTDAVSPLLIHLLTTSFEKKIIICLYVCHTQVGVCMLVLFYFSFYIFVAAPFWVNLTITSPALFFNQLFVIALCELLCSKTSTITLITFHHLNRKPKKDFCIWVLWKSHKIML